MTQTKLTFQLDAEGEGGKFAFAGAPPKELVPGSRHVLTPFGTDAAILLRDGAKHAGWFAGSLSAFGVAEVFGYIVSGVRSGRLVLQSGGARRTLHVRDGQVVFATSTERHERLGSALVRLGLLSQAQVDEAAREVKPKVRLGAVLTRAGMLSAQALYSAMTYLVREIVLDLFELDEGEFFFFEGEPAPSDALKLPEATRELVLTGMRRSEEMLALRRRWPPETTVSPESGFESPFLLRLGLLDDTPQSLKAIRTKFSGSEHALLSLVDELATSGVLTKFTPESKAAVAPETPKGSASERYQGIIAEVAKALIAAGKDLSSLRAYLLEPGPKLKAAFEGVTLSDEGALDVARVLKNVPESEDALGRVRAHDALDAFLSYALFSAQNAIAEEDFTLLRESVNTLRGAL